MEAAWINVLVITIHAERQAKKQAPFDPIDLNLDIMMMDAEMLNTANAFCLKPAPNGFQWAMVDDDDHLTKSPQQGGESWKRRRDGPQGDS